MMIWLKDDKAMKMDGFWQHDVIAPFGFCFFFSSIAETTPTEETPKVDEPKVDEPKVEEEPKAEQPKEEEPVKEEELVVKEEEAPKKSIMAVLCGCFVKAPASSEETPSDEKKADEPEAEPTKDDAEVDLIVEVGKQRRFALEIKSTTLIDETSARSLEALAGDIPNAELILVSNDPRSLRFGRVQAMHWTNAIKKIFGYT